MLLDVFLYDSSNCLSVHMKIVPHTSYKLGNWSETSAEGTFVNWNVLWLVSQQWPVTMPNGW